MVFNYISMLYLLLTSLYCQLRKKILFSADKTVVIHNRCRNQESDEVMFHRNKIIKQNSLLILVSKHDLVPHL